MMIIKKLCKRIKKELCNANDYAEAALRYKDSDKILAESCYVLATERLKDVDILHEQVVRIITNYKKEKGEPPAPMQTLYDYEHEEQIENAREVRVLLEMYKD